MRKRFPVFCFVLVSLVALASAAPEDRPRRLVILGDSITSGHGLNKNEAYPAVLAEKVRAANLPYEVVNAGVGGDTSAGGLRRIDWLLQEPIDVLVIELGGNDGLRGLPLDALKKNLQGIIDKTRSRYPGAKIVLAGMRIPPNLGREYAEGFQQIYPELARENDALLIPFLLEGVGGVRALNQSDLIHPTADGHKLIADVVWAALAPLLRAG